MNHEQHHPAPQQSPQEQRVDDHVINYLISAAPTPEAASQITKALAEYGPAIAAFLRLDDTDPYSPDLALNFLNCYHGQYSSMNQLIDEVIATQDWDSALQHVLAAHPELERILIIDRGAIAALIQERFDIVHMGDLHVFEK